MGQDDNVITILILTTAYLLYVLKHQSFIFRAFGLLKPLIWKACFLFFNLRLESRKMCILICWCEYGKSFKCAWKEMGTGKSAVFVGSDPWQNQTSLRFDTSKAVEPDQFSTTIIGREKECFCIKTTMHWRHPNSGAIGVWYHLALCFFFPVKSHSLKVIRSDYLLWHR